ncbi:hypothetical protein [Mucilaginibacter boryungensis]|uniref:Substrate import-associated zinc metallohydrolase lipoprotein n=1 Tax=Mucilaginibacter boryungensis TaxID=768480 RepID=A0ABR9XDC8_9SPHI|nr:hypothetical protein [Mucilaginibacter boryungensis]MBE9665180.1 hypothetical protein [Mucilaginibacter boryungensis]
MKLKFTSLALIAIVIFFSCRKSYDTSNANLETTVSKTFSVKDAQSYLDTNLHLKASSLNSIVLNSTRHLSSSAYFMFNRAKVGSIRQFEVVEIPVALSNNVIPFYNFAKDNLKYKPDMSVFHASFTRMLVYKNQQTKEISSVLVTYIPDKEYLLANKNDASNNTIAKMSPLFKGYLQYQDKDGNIKYVLRIINGRTVHKYVYSASGRMAIQGTKLKVNDWVEQCVDHYQVGCVVGPEGELINCGEPVYLGTDCTIWYEPDSPNNNDPTPPEDNGGSGGGGGGSAGGGIATLSVQGINLPPCITAILNSINSAAYQVAAVASMFNDPIDIPDSYGVGTMLNTVMNNPAYGITFSVGNNFPGTNASTSPSALYPVTTELQSSYTSTATQLSVARTIMHETIHAYFQYGLANFQNDPNFANFQTINDVLFDTNGNPQNDQNLAQHNAMALDYVSGITSMLVIYANMNNITSPDPNRTIQEYCSDLAWAGLFGTNAYKSLSQTDRDRINDTALKEQDNLQGSTGKKACQ